MTTTQIKETLNTLYAEYRKAASLQNWSQMKTLNDQITDLEQKLIKGYYTNLGCFR